MKIVVLEGLYRLRHTRHDAQKPLYAAGVCTRPRPLSAVKNLL